MKKVVVLAACCLLSIGNSFAQDANALRDEGDAALKAKDYPTAVAKYSEYLKQSNYQDTVRIFNCGFAANQAKNYAEAAKFFDMAVKMNYNVDDAYVGAAMAYRNLNQTEDFLRTTEAGLKAIPADNKNKANLEKLVYAYCIKQGQAAQKKGDLTAAEKMYKEVVDLSNKSYQSKAYYCLGAMMYGNGAKILTGVSMANNRIRLPRDYRRSLQMELYCIRLYGLYDHMRRRKIKDPGYLASLLGKLNYWLMLEPENAFAKQHYRELSQLYRQSI